MLSMPASTVRVRHPHVERALIAIPILNTPNQCQVPTPVAFENSLSRRLLAFALFNV